MSDSVLFLNAKSTMKIGNICTLVPGKNIVDADTLKKLAKTKIGKYLWDKEILAKNERDPDRVYKIPEVDPNKLAERRAGLITKPEGHGKHKDKPMSDGGSIELPPAPGQE